MRNVTKFGDEIVEALSSERAQRLLPERGAGLVPCAVVVVVADSTPPEPGAELGRLCPEDESKRRTAKKSSGRAAGGFRGGGRAGEEEEEEEEGDAAPVGPVMREARSRRVRQSATVSAVLEGGCSARVRRHAASIRKWWLAGGGSIAHRIHVWCLFA